MFDFPLVTSADEMRDGYLSRLLGASGDVCDVTDLTARCEAFVCLADQFLMKQPNHRYAFEDLVFDSHALKMMLARFQRDAFGVGRLWAKLDARIEDETLRKELKGEIMNLGLRVASEDPRKTRIAAVFSLWLCTFRPVAMRSESTKSDPRAPWFCAGLNFWIAQSYLSIFGKVIAGDGFREHLNRIVHDFTFREVNLSSLEVLYSGIFRPDPAKV